MSDRAQRPLAGSPLGSRDDPASTARQVREMFAAVVPLDPLLARRPPKPPAPVKMRTAAQHGSSAA